MTQLSELFCPVPVDTSDIENTPHGNPCGVKKSFVVKIFVVTLGSGEQLQYHILARHTRGKLYVCSYETLPKQVRYEFQLRVYSALLVFLLFFCCIQQIHHSCLFRDILYRNRMLLTGLFFRPEHFQNALRFH